MVLNIKNTTQWVGIVAAMALCCGCSTLGFLLSPGPNERPKPAEYDLKKNAGGKVLVLVDIAGSIPSEADLTERLTSRLAGFLVKKVRLSGQQIIPYIPETAASARTDPAVLAQRAGAELVLYTRVVDYELQGFQDGRYYTGMLVCRAALIRADDSSVLWPTGLKGREINVAVDVETAGRDKALDRLANAAAHCITRAFYNCSTRDFGITEERLSLRELTEQ